MKKLTRSAAIFLAVLIAAAGTAQAHQQSRFRDAAPDNAPHIHHEGWRIQLGDPPVAKVECRWFSDNPQCEHAAYYHVNIQAVNRNPATAPPERWYWHLFLNARRYSDRYESGCEGTIDATQVGVDRTVNYQLCFPIRDETLPRDLVLRLDSRGSTPHQYISLN